MVPKGVHSVATIGKFRPDTISQELVLAAARPTRQTPRMPMVGPQHLLKKHNIRMSRSYGFTQLVQNEATIEDAEPLMGVQRQNAQCVLGGILLHASLP